MIFTRVLALVSSVAVVNGTWVGLLSSGSLLKPYHPGATIDQTAVRRNVHNRDDTTVNLVIDGGFEAFDCGSFGIPPCSMDQTINWRAHSTSGWPNGEIIRQDPWGTHYSHSGNDVGRLGSGDATNPFGGTLENLHPLMTVPGERYNITFWHKSTLYPWSTLPVKPSFAQALWNGEVVGTVPAGKTEWTEFSFTVTAAGNDIIAFYGEGAPTWSYIDDIQVFQV